MNSRFFTASVVAVGTCLCAANLHAAYLLTGNVTNGGVFATGTPKIATGATYSYLYDSSGNLRGNTDKDIIDHDTSFTKLKDGVSELAGSSYSSYGHWDGGSGAGSGSGPFTANVATVVYDLKSVYTLSSAMISTYFKTNDAATDLQIGIGAFQVWTSSDGINYSLSGTWSDASPSKNATAEYENKNEILTVALPNVDARYVMFYFNRLADAANHQSAHQMVLGELAVFGDPVAIPEAASLLALMGGLPLLLKHKRK